MTAVRRIVRPGAPPRVPVVLPVVRVDVDSDGFLQVAIRQKPYDVPESQASRGRDALRGIVDGISQRLGPVRVEVTESDGSVFTDIATAPSPSPTEPDPPGPSPVSPGEVAGAGFLPGEEVAVAVIITHQPAGADGKARVRLPPVVLAARQGRVVLLGRTSGTLAWGDAVSDGVCDGAGGGL